MSQPFPRNISAKIKAQIKGKHVGLKCTDHFQQNKLFVCADIAVAPCLNERLSTHMCFQGWYINFFSKRNLLSVYQPSNTNIPNNHSVYKKMHCRSYVIRILKSEEFSTSFSLWFDSLISPKRSPTASRPFPPVLSISHSLFQKTWK